MSSNPRCFQRCLSVGIMFFISMQRDIEDSIYTHVHVYICVCIYLTWTINCKEKNPDVSCELINYPSLKACFHLGTERSSVYFEEYRSWSRNILVYTYDITITYGCRLDKLNIIEIGRGSTHTEDRSSTTVSYIWFVDLFTVNSLGRIFERRIT